MPTAPILWAKNDSDLIQELLQPLFFDQGAQAGGACRADGPKQSTAIQPRPPLKARFLTAGPVDHLTRSSPLAPEKAILDLRRMGQKRSLPPQIPKQLPILRKRVLPD